jgi:hypothetical protein
MNRNALSVFLAVALTIILSSFSVNAQQPRAVPPNDNFINATAIRIGKSYTVTGIDAATNEVGEPVTSCRGGTLIPHTVWFTFTQPMGSSVALSTFGSILLMPQIYSMDTVLAVYELTGPATFNEIACNDDANGMLAAQLVFNANGEKTYYIAAGSFSQTTFSPGSTMKLTSRMLSTSILPLNYEFESPINSPGWTLKNADDDQIVCSNPAYPAVNGDCTFRFTGISGRTTKLVQTVPFPPAFTPRKNAFLGGGFYYRNIDIPSLSSAKVKFTVSYNDGTPPYTQTVNLAGAAPFPGYTLRLVTIPLKSSKVASVKALVKFGEPAGILLIDYIYFFYMSDPMTRGGLLPVPPAADEEQGMD